MSFSVPNPAGAFIQFDVEAACPDVAEQLFGKAGIRGNVFVQQSGSQAVGDKFLRRQNAELVIDFGFLPNGGFQLGFR